MVQVEVQVGLLKGLRLLVVQVQVLVGQVLLLVQVVPDSEKVVVGLVVEVGGAGSSGQPHLPASASEEHNPLLATIVLP